MDIGGFTFGGFDVVVLVLLGFSGILSFARGFSREVISVISLLLGLAGALFIYGRYRIDAQNFIQPTWLADAALFIGVFLLIYLIITFFMRGWAKEIRGNQPGFLDRLLGLAFGLLRGTILASLFVLVVSKSASEEKPAEWMTETTTYPILRQIADVIEPLPFVKVKELAEDIQPQGEESDILPDIPDQEE